MEFEFNDSALAADGPQGISNTEALDLSAEHAKQQGRRR